MNKWYVTRNNLNQLTEYIRLEKYDRAEKEFKKILSEDSEITKEVIRAIYELGEVFAVRNAGLYINKINYTLRKKPKNILLRLIRQEIAYNSDDYDTKDLIEINKKDLEEFPEDPNLIHFKGVILWNLDKYDLAIRYIDQALDLDKDNVDFLRNKALVYVYKNEFAEARKVIQRAFGLEPNYAPLKETAEEIDRTELEEDFKEQVDDMRKTINKQEDAIKNIKFEFIQMSALFVVVLTLVVKIVKIDYENIKGMGFFEIIINQIALNFSWLFALILMLGLIIFLHIRRNN